MIRKATYQDISSILKITKACAKRMINKEIFQWNEYYPNKLTFENDINHHVLFVLEIESEIIACIVISTFIDEEYKSVNWLTENKNNIYIHRLAVHPKHQGKGIAQQLMDYAEAFAIENNYTSIRLDTFSQNKRNQKFYELRNYKRLGEIYFPKQSNYPFYCYELVF
jgi:ribosomal protein S18 acetylase RimI-like enzyme